MYFLGILPVSGATVPCDDNISDNSDRAHCVGDIHLQPVGKGPQPGAGWLERH